MISSGVKFSVGTRIMEAISRQDTEADYAQRYHSGDALVHDYLKRELANPELFYLTPWCQRGKLLPTTSLRRKIDPQPLSCHAKREACTGCGSERQVAREGQPS